MALNVTRLKQVWSDIKYTKFWSYTKADLCKASGPILQVAAIRRDNNQAYKMTGKKFIINGP
jgi:hypothetical protein